MDKHEYIKLGVGLVQTGNMTRKEFEDCKHAIETQFKQTAMQDPNYIPKDWVKAPFAITAYTYILENGCTADEAFNHAIEVHGKDEDWLKDAKNYKFYYSKDVVDAHDNHPKQKAMVKRKTIHKSALKASGTVNQQMRTLARDVNVDNRLLDLEGDVKHLKGQDKKHATQIQMLKMGFIISDGVSKKDLAMRMKDLFTQKDIADYLDITTRTLRRWYDDD